MFVVKEAARGKYRVPKGGKRKRDPRDFVRGRSLWRGWKAKGRDAEFMGALVPSATIPRRFFYRRAIPRAIRYVNFIANRSFQIELRRALRG